MSIDEGPFQNIVDLRMPFETPEYDLTVTLQAAHAGWLNLNDYAPFSNRDCNTSCQAKSWTIANQRAFVDIGWRTYWLPFGWEDPPHPGVTLVGQSSGKQATLGTHCATRLTSCWSVSRYNDYCINEGYGGSGLDFLVDEGSANESDFPWTNGIFHLAYIVSPVFSPPPWTSGEDVACTIHFTDKTLPDPGPYNILSAQAHRFRANTTVLNLDRAIRFASPSALCISGTTSGTYDGMKFAYEWGDDFLHSADQISIKSTFTTGVTTGSALRHFDAAFDNYYALAFPTGSPPSLPGGC